jgi:hypothetical protein
VRGEQRIRYLVYSDYEWLRWSPFNLTITNTKEISLEVSAVEHFLGWTATAWAAVASIVGALSLIVLGTINYLYLRTAREQARAAADQVAASQQSVKEAREANRISNDLLQQQQRPWVGLDEESAAALSAGPISIDKDGLATIPYTIRFRNYGNAPAQGVLAIAQLMITEDLEDIVREEESLRSPNADRTVGCSLFPDRASGMTSTSAFPSSRMKSKSYDHLFEAWLIVSIRYRDRFGNHYHSGFRYWMVGPDVPYKPFRFTPLPNTVLTAMPFFPNGSGESIS